MRLSPVCIMASCVYISIVKTVVVPENYCGTCASTVAPECLNLCLSECHIKHNCLFKVKKFMGKFVVKILTSFFSNYGIWLGMSSENGNLLSKWFNHGCLHQRINAPCTTDYWCKQIIYQYHLTSFQRVLKVWWLKRFVSIFRWSTGRI